MNSHFLDDESDSDVKIADFGFAKQVNPEKPNCLTTQCGTPEYVGKLLKNVILFT